MEMGVDRNMTIAYFAENCIYATILAMEIFFFFIPH